MITLATGALLSFVLGAPGAQGLVPRTYTVTNLGTPFPTEDVVSALAVSNEGHVTGEGRAAAGSSRTTFAYRWLDGEMTLVQRERDAAHWTLEGGRDVNGAGAVVGAFGLSANVKQHGFHSAGGRSTELFDPAGFPAFPSAINDAGWVVGKTTTITMPGVQPEAVMWSPDSAPAWIGDFVTAHAINDTGVIAGSARVGGVALAAIFEAGETTVLGTLDPSGPSGTGASTAFAINDAGAVVGTSDVGLTSAAFHWTAATGLVKLPGLGVGGDGATVTAINADGLILGRAPAASGGKIPALWDRRLVAHELAALVPDMVAGGTWLGPGIPQDLNDHGQISGVAFHVPSDRRRAYLLTPAALQLDAPSTGIAGTVHRVRVTGAEPHARLLLFGDLDDPLDLGYRRLPECGGVGVSMARPVVVAVGLADDSGTVTLAWQVPAELAGVAVRLQAAAPCGCDVSNVLELAL